MTAELEEKIKELKLEIDEKDERIQELEFNVSDLEDEKEDLMCLVNQNVYYEDNKDQLAENSFKAGYKAKENDQALIKAWLNYKIEARI